MPFANGKPFTFDRTVRLVIFIAVIWGALQVLNYLSDVLVPFAIALLLAYLLNPLVNFIQHKLRVKRRALSVILTLLLVFGSLTLLLTLLIPRLVNDAKHVGDMLSAYVNNTEVRNRVQQWLPNDLQQRFDEFTRNINVEEILSIENLEKTIDLLAQKILPGVWGVFSGSVTFIITLVGFTIVGLYLIFILIDYQTIGEKWQNLIPQRYRLHVVEVVGEIEKAMNTYFRAQAIIALTVGILIAIGFAIIGLPMGVPLGLFIGMLNLVPYLQIVGFIPAAFFCLLHSLETGESFLVMLGLVLLVQTIVQVIQDVILTPKIMGNATGLNPAVILLSLTIWGKLLGLLGLLIALPLTSIMLVYYNRFLRYTELPPPNTIAETVAAENTPTAQEEPPQT